MYPPHNVLLRGAASICRRLPSRSAYGFTEMLVRADISGDLPPVSARRDVGWCTEKDYTELMRHEEARNPDAFARRRLLGHEAYFIKIGGRLVSHSWVAYDACYSMAGFENAFRFNPLPAGEAFVYDLYTYKSHQQSGVGLRLQAAFRNALKERGIRAVWGIVNPTNAASVRVHFAVGCVPVRMVYGYRVGSHCRTVLGPVDPALPEWARRYRKPAKRAGEPAAV